MAAVSEPEQPAAFEDWKVPGLAELKPASVAGAVLYVLGLIVANSYFSTLGFHDFSLLKPQTILTGAWAALFLFCAALPVVAYHSAWKNTLKKPRLSRFFQRVFVLIATPALVTFMVSMLRILTGISPNINDHTWGAIWIQHWELTPPGWGTLLVIMNLPPFLFLMRADDSVRSLLTPSQILYVPAFFCLIGAVWLGIQMYPAVSPVFGGGRAEQDVEFLFSSEGNPVASQIASRFGGGETLPVRAASGLIEGSLLYRNEAVFVLEIRSCVANKLGKFTVVVDRKLISAYFPSGQLFQSDPIEQSSCNPKIDSAVRLGPVSDSLLVQGSIGRCKIVSASPSHYYCVLAEIRDGNDKFQRLEPTDCKFTDRGAWADIYSCEFKLPEGLPRRSFVTVTANGVSSDPYPL